MANDILDLLGSIPYDQRSSGGPVTQEIRKAIQAQAIKRQQNSERFQREAAAKNKSYALPPEMQALLQGQDSQAQQQGAPTQGPPGASPQAAGAPPSQAIDASQNVGSLFNP